MLVVRRKTRQQNRQPLNKDTTITYKLFHFLILTTIPTLKDKKILYFLHENFLEKIIVRKEVGPPSPCFSCLTRPVVCASQLIKKTHKQMQQQDLITRPVTKHSEFPVSSHEERCMKYFHTHCLRYTTPTDHFDITLAIRFSRYTKLCWV